MALPAEIWRHISLYLPLDNLKELYSVNQALFHLAMDIRYKDVRFDQRNQAVIYRAETLRQPKFASRVRSLYIAPHRLHESVEDGHNLYEDELRSSKSRILKFTRRVFGGRLSRQHSNEVQVVDRDAEDGPISAAQVCKTLVEVIPLLVNVHILYLSWVSEKEYLAPYIDISYKSFCHNLTEFDLTITTTKILAMFPLPVLFLRLESLKIHILGRTSLVACQAALSSFVNTLHSTLKRLAVRSTPVRNLSDFYLGLGHFNTLICIDVDISTDASFKSTIPGYTSFIDQQRQVTEELLLYLPSEQSTTWSLEELRLSKLERLSISAAIVDNYWDHSSRFMKRHMKKLSEFSTDGRIHPSRLTSFLDIFHHRNPYSLLTTLSFSAVILDVKLIDQLANGLFRLQRLTLRIDAVALHGRASIIPSDHYPQGLVGGVALPERLYLIVDYDPNHCQAADPPIVRGLRSCDSLRKWELSDLTVKRHSCCGELVLWGLMQLCSQYTPSIKSFMGNGNLEVPVPSNRPPKHSVTSQKVPSGTCQYGRDHTS